VILEKFETFVAVKVFPVVIVAKFTGTAVCGNALPTKILTSKGGAPILHSPSKH
jgi:hypothetical protein